MKTLIEINHEVLNEFTDWKNANPNWNIGDYLNLKYDMNAAIAFSKLYFPDFIEKEGCILLGFRYDENAFWKWHAEFQGDVKKIEYKCNFFEVMDYFSNRESYQSEENYNIAIDEFAQILMKSWSLNLKILFPDREMIVEVFDEFNTTRITLFSH